MFGGGRKAFGLWSLFLSLLVKLFRIAWAGRYLLGFGFIGSFIKSALGFPCAISLK